MLSFEMPKRNDDQSAIFELPGKPITEMNYFSMRFRLIDYQEDYWSTCGQISIEYRDDQVGEEIGPISAVSMSRYTANHFLEFRPNQIENNLGSVEDLQYNFWHTMEMAIKPTSPGPDTYILAYWFDNVLVAEYPINEEDIFPETENRTFLWYHFGAGRT